jgi:hypothetical protein
VGVVQTIGAKRIGRFWLFDSFDGFSPEYSSPADFREPRLDLPTAYRQPGLYEAVGEAAPLPISAW